MSRGEKEKKKQEETNAQLFEENERLKSFKKSALIKQEKDAKFIQEKLFEREELKMELEKNYIDKKHGETKYEILNSNFNELKENYNDLENRYHELKTKEEQQKLEIDKILHDNSILSSQHSTLKDKLSSLLSAMSGVAETQHADLSASLQQQYQSHLQSFQSQLHHLQIQTQQQLVIIDSMKLIHIEDLQTISTLNSTIKELNQTINEKEQFIARLNLLINKNQNVIQIEKKYKLFYSKILKLSLIRSYVKLFKQRRKMCWIVKECSEYLKRCVQVLYSDPSFQSRSSGGGGGGGEGGKDSSVTMMGVCRKQQQELAIEMDWDIMHQIEAQVGEVDECKSNSSRGSSCCCSTGCSHHHHTNYNNEFNGINKSTSSDVIVFTQNSKW